MGKVEVNERVSDVIIVNGAFIGFWVPAGSSRVVVRYRPWPYYTAVMVSLLSLAGLAIVLRTVGSPSRPRIEESSGEGSTAPKPL
jgi:uncharacterized membrane protein YfhO